MHVAVLESHNWTLVGSAQTCWSDQRNHVWLMPSNRHMWPGWWLAWGGGARLFGLHYVPFTCCWGSLFVSQYWTKERERNLVHFLLVPHSTYMWSWQVGYRWEGKWTGFLPDSVLTVRRQERHDQPNTEFQNCSPPQFCLLWWLIWATCISRFLLSSQQIGHVSLHNTRTNWKCFRLELSVDGSMGFQTWNLNNRAVLQS